MKNKTLLLILFSALVMSCETRKPSKKIKIIDKVPTSFEMYKTSEMANLMRLMLLKNNELREKIIDGEDIGDFNEEYLKIHTAKMTDASQKDETYPTFATHFEQMQKDVFLVDKAKRKEQFNNTVNACVACHKDRCTGPIPRIKKLLIK